MVGPKLRSESNAHVGPGPAPAGAKRGAVDVHRGGVYITEEGFYLPTLP
jgi:hypothetical protein